VYALHGNIVRPDIHLVGDDIVQVIEQHDVIGLVLQRGGPVFAGLEVIKVDRRPQAAEDPGVRIDGPLPVRVRTAERVSARRLLYKRFHDRGLEIHDLFRLVHPAAEVGEHPPHLPHLDLDADGLEYFECMLLYRLDLGVA